MTQEECAEKLGVSRQSLSTWETGRAYPDVRSVLAISETFGCSLDSLLKEDASAVRHLADSGDLVKSRRLLFIRLAILAYLVIWSFLIAVFWLSGGAESAVLKSVLSLILLAVTGTLSFFIGFGEELPRAKWFLSLFFGLFYFLARFLTFDLAVCFSAGAMPLPRPLSLFPGILFSFAVIGLGEIFRILKGLKKSKKGD